MGMDGQNHALAAVPPGMKSGTHCIAGWVGPSASLNGCEKSPPGFDRLTV